MGTYRNIMEMLVEEEVIRQCKALPARASSYLNSEELIAYALNQLPPLYATSEQGLEYQVQKGKVKFGPQISQAVQRAIAAVRRDPLRRHTPLQQQSQGVPLNDVLQQVRQLLKDDEVQWETLPSAVENALKRVAFRAAQGGATWHDRPDRRMVSSEDSSSQARISRSAQTAIAASTTHPVSSMPAPTPQAAPIKPAPEPKRLEYGWDDPLYYSR